MSKIKYTRRLITLPEEQEQWVKEKIEKDKKFNFSGLVQEKLAKVIQREEKTSGDNNSKI